MFRQSEPLEILGASPDDAPFCDLRVNSEWGVLLIGLAEYLLSPWYWDESTGDPDSAIADAARLIEILGGCVTDHIGVFAEQRASGVNGGTSVAAGYQYRVINTVIVAASWATLSGGQIQLSPGKYHLRARAVGYGVGAQRITLHNATAPITYWRGNSSRARQIAPDQWESWIEVEAVVTVPATENFLLLHYTGNAVTNVGLGIPVGDTYPEQYATVVVTRLPS